MIKNLGLQLYTVCNCFLDEDYADLTFKKMAEYGYTEAQHAGWTYGIKPEIFVEKMEKNGIKMIGTHYDYKQLANNFEENVRRQKLFKTTNIGLGYLSPEIHKSLDTLKEFIENFNKLAEAYAKEGFKLSYHNHQFEFKRINGTKTIMDYLYEGFDPATTSFVLDTCWVQAGGADIDEWMEKLAGRIDILHLKDVMLKFDNGHYYGDATEVGCGTINWKKVIDLAEKIGVKHYVVEQDGDFIGGNPLKSIKASADYLKQFMVK